MKTLKKTFIMIILTLICVILIDNYNRAKDEQKLEKKKDDGKTDISETDKKNNEPDEPSYYVTLLALGQNYMNDSVIHSGQQEDGSSSYDFLFEGVKEELDRADISAMCIGSVIGGNSLGVSGYPTFNSPEEFCDAVIATGIDAAAMANVRINNMGSAAISNCIDIWKSKSEAIRVLGIRASQEESFINIIEANGLKIALLDYTAIVTEAISNEEAYKINFFGDYANGSANLEKLSENTLAQINEACNTADFVVAFASWGLENTHDITATQERFAKQLAEAGVDLIIGNRPNYLQKIEWITADNGNRALCYYSLGNFTSSENTADGLLGGMAKVSIKVEQGLTIIDEENTGLIPVVTHYTYSGSGDEVDIKGTLPLTLYTEEMAAEHGIKSKYGAAFGRETLLSLLNNTVDVGWILEQ
ncbi:MAG: CapA family protein [Lachnospiraceae bacterium]|nr:CapA family protein [Lachnospiraceae bacterium]